MCARTRTSAIAYRRPRAWTIAYPRKSINVVAICMANIGVNYSRCKDTRRSFSVKTKARAFARTRSKSITWEKPKLAPLLRCGSSTKRSHSNPNAAAVLTVTSKVDYVREVHSSIFGLGQRQCLRFFMVLLGSYRWLPGQYIKFITSASFRIFSNSLFTDHPGILPYIL